MNHDSTKSFTAKDAEGAKKKKSFTAKIAKAAKENNSLTAKDAKENNLRKLTPWPE